MSFNNSSAGDGVICLFQTHGPSEKQLVKCTGVNARVNCAVILLDLRILRVRRSLNSVQVLLILGNTFLVLVLDVVQTSVSASMA